MPLRSEIIYNVRIKLQIRSTPDHTIFDLDVGKAIDNAAMRLSRDFPAEATQEYLGNGESTYPLPSGWDAISVITAIFFSPYRFIYDKDRYLIIDDVDDTARDLASVGSGATEVTLSTIAQAAYFKDGDVVAILNDGAQVEQNWVAADGDPSTGVVTLKNATAAAYSTSPQLQKLPQLTFLQVIPSASDLFKIKYTKTHVVSDESEAANTILAKHQDAFEHLAAALAAYEISAKYANTQDPSIEADAVDYGAKSEQWREVAEAEMKLYEDHLNLGAEKKTEAASVMVNLNLSQMPGMNALYPAERTGYYP